MCLDCLGAQHFFKKVISLNLSNTINHWRKNEKKHFGNLFISKVWKKLYYRHLQVRIGQKRKVTTVVVFPDFHQEQNHIFGFYSAVIDVGARVIEVGTYRRAIGSRRRVFDLVRVWLSSARILSRTCVPACDSTQFRHCSSWACRSSFWNAHVLRVITLTHVEKTSMKFGTRLVIRPDPDGHSDAFLMKTKWKPAKIDQFVLPKWLFVHTCMLTQSVVEPNQLTPLDHCFFLLKTRKMSCPGIQK